MKLVIRLVVIVVMAIFILRLYEANPTMALVLGGLGFAGVIMWITGG